MSSQAHIVLVHGAWSDGSIWSRIIPLLQDAGHRTTAVQLSLAGELARETITVRVAFAGSGPAILVGHD